MPIYVQHAVLGRIPDVFNAEAIWQAPGLALFSRRPLLRDLLERSPREHRGRAATRCFSHVTLMLPQEDVDDDYHLTRGARARDLAQTLTALHQKDFGDLLGADQVRYDVVGTEALAPGQIEVKFGHAVYLPAADEKILYNISVSRDSAIWHPVCPIYPSQRLALINGDASEASFAAPGWPFGPDGAILVINDGPDTPPTLQMRPKDGYDCHFDPRSGYYTIASKRDIDGGGQRLLLKVTRVSAAPAFAAQDLPFGAANATSAASVASVAHAADIGRDSIRPAVWHNRASVRDLLAADSQTALPASPKPRQPINRAGESDATYVPIAQQRVSLVALALPRLSRYRETGAVALELPFDPALAIASGTTGPAAAALAGVVATAGPSAFAGAADAGSSSGAATAISFIVTSADELYACTPAGRQRISAPASFTPVDTRAITLQPSPAEMADRYCAMLCLPQPLAAPVAGGARFTFGRGSAMLAALRILDSPRFLRQARGTEHASADRLGLSRKAFSFEATPQGFQIGRLAATQALYHLDEKMAFVASLADTSAEAPYLLPAGHHLVAGHYVLRFDA